MTTKPKGPGKGGARPGAGRPVTNPTRPITLRLNAAQKAEFDARGGATAVKAWLDKPIGGKRDK